MSKYRIDGIEYDTDEIDPSGQDMVDMSKQAGMGIQTWERTIGQIPRLTMDAEGQVTVLSESVAAPHLERSHDPCPDCPRPGLFTESAPHLTAFLILIWLARRAAGERRLRFDDAASVPWSKFEMVEEADEAEPDESTEVEDPTPPPASAQGTGGGSARSTRSRKA